MSFKQDDKKYIANTYARFDLEISHGNGALVYDINGKEYIDLASGIAANTLGMADSEWVEAVYDQLKKCQHTSNLYYSEPCVQLAKILCERTGAKKVFFGNSGAEANECAAAWAYAARATTPVALILTRQDLAPYSADTAKRIDISKGAYVVDCEDGFEYVLIATGSEVNLALEAAKLLRAEGKKVRVVSMPSRELFLAQSKEYQESVIPTCPCKKRVTIEAASTFGWEKFAGDKGLCIGLDHFGASAPYKVLAEKFGFTPQAVVDKINAFFA